MRDNGMAGEFSSCSRKRRGGANKKNRVTLKVGGHRFETSIETLSFDGCSMLAAMVMRHLPNEEEAILIHQDPERFRHAVQKEAGFFNLSGLYNLDLRREILCAKMSRSNEVVGLQGTLKAMMDELRGTMRMVTITSRILCRFWPGDDQDQIADFAFVHQLVHELKLVFFHSCLRN
ncbi:unnamed protein product [Calypogeia fissa]